MSSFDHQDLLQTIVDIAFAGAGKETPEAFKKAVAANEAEMELEFEDEHLVDSQYEYDCDQADSEDEVFDEL